MTTAFWLAALAIVALAWAIALPPLWRGGGAGPKPRREQNIEIARARLQRLEAQIRGGEIDAEEAARFRVEIERELLLDADADSDADSVAAEETPAPPRRLPRAPLAAAVVCLPLVAAALYAALGEPGALSAAPRPPDLAQAATTLRERLQADDNEDGWILLGRAESELGRFDAAAAAFARAIEIGGETPAALALQVDALLMGAAARQETAAPSTAAALISRAIEIDPDHAPSLWLSGLIAQSAGEHEKAAGFWRRLQAVAPQPPPALAAMIADAEALAAAPGSILESNPKSNPESKSEAPSESSPALLRVVVDIDDSFADAIPPSAALFVFARAAAGEGGPPLAVKRLAAGGWPLTIELSDADAMTPNFSLSRQGAPIVVVARASKSGRAREQAGDWFGRSAPFSAPLSGALTVTINRVVR